MVAAANEKGPRCAGVLLHPTSLPGPWGIGTLGAPARQWLHWLGRTGATWWQMLPLGVPGTGHSPYASHGSMGWNPLLLDLDDLVVDGLLDAGELPPRLSAGQPVDHVLVAQTFEAPLRRAADHLLAGRRPDLLAQFEASYDDPGWIRDTAEYLALRDVHGQNPWWRWPQALRDRAPGARDRARDQSEPAMARHGAIQFLVERQWQAVRRQAATHGIALIGDLPFYVDGDSGEVWRSPHRFRLDPDGRSACFGGAPPDAFTPLGQLWRQPVWDWAAMAQEGHAGWVSRLRRELDRVDAARIDHFRGYSAFWEVPAAAEDARMGAWRPGPGSAPFAAARAALGPLPCFLEDLGDLDDDVHRLRQEIDLPGMAVLQFAFDDDDDAHPYRPANHGEHLVCTTGTHDMETLVGWWGATSEAVRHRARRALSIDDHHVAWSLVSAAMDSPARWAVVPVQDLLGLGCEARMNVPGTESGNWAWRMGPDALTDDLADRFGTLLARTGRG